MIAFSPVLIIAGNLPFVTARRPLQLAVFCAGAAVVATGWCLMVINFRNGIRETRRGGR